MEALVAYFSTTLQPTDSLFDSVTQRAAIFTTDFCLSKAELRDHQSMKAAVQLGIKCYTALMTAGDITKDEEHDYQAVTEFFNGLSEFWF